MNEIDQRIEAVRVILIALHLEPWDLADAIYTAALRTQGSGADGYCSLVAAALADDGLPDALGGGDRG